MTYQAQKINWTPERIAQANIPADVKAYIRHVRKDCRNNMSDEELAAQHARFMQALKAHEK